MLKNVRLDQSFHQQTIHVFGGHLPTANGRVDEGNRLFTTVDYGLSISTPWISGIIAGFCFLLCGASLWILWMSNCWARNKIHSNEVKVKRERLTQIVLLIVEQLNQALIYFLYTDLRHSSWLLERKNEVEPMFLSFFIPVGVFLLVAAKRPSEHRSMIALAAWWNISHGAVMDIKPWKPRFTASTGTLLM